MAVTVSNLQNFIDGEFVASQAGATDPVINPATGEEIGQAAVPTPPTSTVRSRPRRRHSRLEPHHAGRAVRWRC